VKKTEREKVAKKKRIGEGVQESKGFKLRPRHLRLDDCLVISNSTSRLSQVLVVYVINGKEGKNESVLGRSKARISKHEISCEGMRIYRSISALSMGKVEVVDVIPLQKQRTKLKLCV
jgi:hypothetical protein